MLDALIDLLGGWKEVRAFQGYSYQVARSGKRRVVPIEGYRNFGFKDEQWELTGRWSDERLHDRYKDYTLPTSARFPDTGRRAFKTADSAMYAR